MRFIGETIPGWPGREDHEVVIGDWWICREEVYVWSGEVWMLRGQWKIRDRNLIS